MANGAERLPHLLVRGYVQAREYSRPGGGNPKVRPVEHRTHGRERSDELDGALDAQDRRRAAFDIDELESLGVILSIEGASGFSLKLESLNRRTQHAEPRPKWILLSVRTATPSTPEVAQIWVSDQYRADFVKLFAQYLEEQTPTGLPKNRALIANMAKIRSTMMLDLWQSDGDPPAGRQWWELWLRPEDNAIELAGKLADIIDGRIATKHLRLEDRHVVWIEATWDDLLVLQFSAVPVAEIRLPQLVIDTVFDLSSEERAEYATDLADRLVAAPRGAPAVCLLDSGVRRSHALLTGSLDETDTHTVFDGGTGDRRGHGTRMAGLALLGPLGPLLSGSDEVDLTHRLESVKLYPDSDEDAHDLDSYGIVTAEATAAPEATAQRGRVFCLPITSKPDRAGEPSLWSAAVDALAVGTAVGRSETGIDLIGRPEDDAKRLFVVSAGNIRDGFASDYLDICDLSAIEDPAQSWNALVVGAHTDLTSIPSDPSFHGWSALAESGGLSPHSRTGVIAGGSQWPIKPDICMEGGNVLTDGAGDFHASHPAVSVATTDRANDSALGVANATSAATAQAARLAARASAAYPAYWPETIRGLMTHGAEWTPAMRGHVMAETGKKKRELLLRRYGWGVPTEAAVETSSANAVTMVVQDTFVPFIGKDHKMRELRLHQLPWPAEVLEDIGEHDVELRVTLSYFVEPSASRRGWRRRYAYASHGLRFDLQRPNECTPDFVARVNRAAKAEEDGDPSTLGDSKWLVGPQQRDRGSLHQDIWTGYGAELATTGGGLVVHAVGGWWKNNNRKDRVDLPVRYALLVSLRTAAENVDLYEPIAVELGIPPKPSRLRSSDLARPMAAQPRQPSLSLGAAAG